jgi:hypothetical protein
MQGMYAAEVGEGQFKMVAPMAASSIAEPRPSTFSPRSIVGFAIVSIDGMLADAAGVMPQSLKVAADQKFFESGLDGVDVVIHGRHSHEEQPRSFMRKRLILTRQIRAIEPVGSAGRECHWNPEGASLDDALEAIDAPAARVGVVGATCVFGLFLNRYDSFYLTRGPQVLLPGGRAVFPDVPRQTPEQILAQAGLIDRDTTVLDPDLRIAVSHWCRPTGVW